MGHICVYTRAKAWEWRWLLDNGGWWRKIDFCYLIILNSLLSFCLRQEKSSAAVGDKSIALTSSLGLHATTSVSVKKKIVLRATSDKILVDTFLCDSAGFFIPLILHYTLIVCSRTPRHLPTSFINRWASLRAWTDPEPDLDSVLRDPAVLGKNRIHSLIFINSTRIFIRVPFRL